MNVKITGLSSDAMIKSKLSKLKILLENIWSMMIERALDSIEKMPFSQHELSTIIETVLLYSDTDAYSTSSHFIRLIPQVLPISIFFYFKYQHNLSQLKLENMYTLIKKSLDHLKKTIGQDFNLVSDENTKNMDNSFKIKTLMDILVLNLEASCLLSTNESTLRNAYLEYLTVLISCIRSAFTAFQNPKKLFLLFCHENTLHQLAFFYHIHSEPTFMDNFKTVSLELQKLIQDVLFDSKYLLDLAHSRFQIVLDEFVNSNHPIEDTIKKRHLVCDENTQDKSSEVIHRDQSAFCLSLYDSLHSVFNNGNISNPEIVAETILQIFVTSSLNMALNSMTEKSTRLVKRFKNDNATTSEQQQYQSISIVNRRKHLIRIIQFSLTLIFHLIYGLQLKSRDVKDKGSSSRLSIPSLKVVTTLLYQLSKFIGGSLPNHEDFDKHKLAFTHVLDVFLFKVLNFYDILMTFDESEVNDDKEVVIDSCAESFQILRFLLDIDHRVVMPDKVKDIISVMSLIYGKFNCDQKLMSPIQKLLNRIIEHYRDLRRLDSLFTVLKQAVNSTDFSKIFQVDAIRDYFLKSMLRIPLTDMVLFWEILLPKTEISNLSTSHCYSTVSDCVLSAQIGSLLSQAHRQLLSTSYVSSLNNDSMKVSIPDDVIRFLSNFNEMIQAKVYQLSQSIDLNCINQFVIPFVCAVIELSITLLSEHVNRFSTDKVNVSSSNSNHLIFLVQAIQSSLTNLIQSPFLSVESELNSNKFQLLCLILKFHVNVHYYVYPISQLCLNSNKINQTKSNIGSSAYDTVFNIMVNSGIIILKETEGVSIRFNIENLTMNDCNERHNDIVSMVMTILNFRSVWSQLQIFTKFQVMKMIELLAKLSCVHKYAHLTTYLAILSPHFHNNQFLEEIFKEIVSNFIVNDLKGFFTSSDKTITHWRSRLILLNQYLSILSKSSHLFYRSTLEIYLILTRIIAYYLLSDQVYEVILIDLIQKLSNILIDCILTDKEEVSTFKNAVTQQNIEDIMLFIIKTEVSDNDKLFQLIGLIVDSGYCKDLVFHDANDVIPKLAFLTFVSNHQDSNCHKLHIFYRLFVNMLTKSPKLHQPVSLCSVEKKKVISSLVRLSRCHNAWIAMDSIRLLYRFKDAASDLIIHEQISIAKSPAEFDKNIFEVFVQETVDMLLNVNQDLVAICYIISSSCEILSRLCVLWSIQSSTELFRLLLSSILVTNDSLTGRDTMLHDVDTAVRALLRVSNKYAVDEMYEHFRSYLMESTVVAQSSLTMLVLCNVVTGFFVKSQLSCKTTAIAIVDMLSKLRSLILLNHSLDLTVITAYLKATGYMLEAIVYTLSQSFLATNANAPVSAISHETLTLYILHLVEAMSMFSSKLDLYCFPTYQEFNKRYCGLVDIMKGVLQNLESVVTVVSMRHYLVQSSLSSIVQVLRVIITKSIRLQSFIQAERTLNSSAHNDKSFASGLDSSRTAHKNEIGDTETSFDLLMDVTCIFEVQIPRILMTIAKFKYLGNHIELITSIMIHLFTTLSYSSQGKNSSYSGIKINCLTAGIQFGMFQLLDHCDQRQKTKIFTMLPDLMSREYYREFSNTYNSEYKFIGKV